jgi:hypothetical protein
MSATSLLGLQTLKYGQIPKLTEAPDILSLSSARHLYVIECTVGDIDRKGKLHRLYDRANQIKDYLSRTPQPPIAVQPLIFTSLTRQETASHWSTAATYRIGLVCRENILNLLNVLDSPPTAEQLYSAAVAAIPPLGGTPPEASWTERTPTVTCRRQARPARHVDLRLGLPAGGGGSHGHLQWSGMQAHNEINDALADPKMKARPGDLGGTPMPMTPSTVAMTSMLTAVSPRRAPSRHAWRVSFASKPRRRAMPPIVAPILWAIAAAYRRAALMGAAMSSPTAANAPTLLARADEVIEW